jgi:glycosyltransferase involved in cell wall biosynthesis
MTRILAIGTGPLLEPGVTKIGGQCLRTWHFVKPLLEAGHEVTLVTLPIPDRDAPTPDSPVVKKHYGDFAYSAIQTHDPHSMLDLVSRLFTECAPDCILGINALPSFIACQLPTHKPVWVDLNGYAMAEGQMRARRYGDDESLKFFWAQEQTVARRADKFSTVSTPQAHALIGELGLVGRLNRWTAQYQFVTVIPNAVNEIYLREPDPGTPCRLRGVSVPSDAFIVLWSGGYNTWTDVDMLTTALTKAMSQNPTVHYVSTGGMVEGHDEITYSQFQKRISESPYRDRFVLQGWIDASLLPAYYRESSLGLNIDSWNYETLFGARNRLTNMIAMGLPVLTTLGTEISHVIKTHQLGLTVEIGNADEMAALIVEAAGRPQWVREIGERGKAFARQHYSYTRTTQAVQEWASDPHPAPDTLRKTSLDATGKNPACIALNEIEKYYSLLSNATIHELEQASRDLEAIRQKLPLKLYRALKRAIKGSRHVS